MMVYSIGSSIHFSPHPKTFALVIQHSYGTSHFFQGVISHLSIYITSSCIWHFSHSKTFPEGTRPPPSCHLIYSPEERIRSTIKPNLNYECQLNQHDSTQNPILGHSEAKVRSGLRMPSCLLKVLKCCRCLEDDLGIPVMAVDGIGSQMWKPPWRPYELWGYPLT